MKRVKQLTEEQIQEWRKRRQEIGSDKYGETDLWRYGMVDILEELLDVLNILDRAQRRWQMQSDVSIDTSALTTLTDQAIQEAMRIDAQLPASVCMESTPRIWWNEVDCVAEYGEGEA